jgi:hypothetical protein
VLNRELSATGVRFDRALARRLEDLGAFLASRATASGPGAAAGKDVELMRGEE